MTTAAVLPFGKRPMKAPGSGPTQTCARCGSVLGMLASGRCRPWIRNGTEVECADRAPCNRVRFDTIDPREKT